MRANASRGDNPIPAGFMPGCDAPSERGLAYAPLSLPTLSQEAARRRTVGGDNPKIVAMARQMLGLGLLDGADPEATLDQVVTTALEKWVASTWGGMSYFDLNCSLEPDFFECVGYSKADVYQVQEVPVVQAAIERACGLHPETPHVSLTLHASYRRDILVGDGVLALEAKHEGLGFEVLRAVEQVGAACGLFGFAWIKDKAEQLYWAFGESEANWASEYGESLEHFGGIKRAEFDQAVPPQTVTPRKPMSLKTLTAISKSSDGDAATAARLLLQLRRSKTASFGLYPLAELLEWYVDPNPTLLLGWRGFDLVYRIGDDFEMAYLQDSEYGPPPGFGIFLLELGSASAFDSIAKRWKPIAHRLRLADAMLGLIAKESESAVA